MTTVNLENRRRIQQAPYVMGLEEGLQTTLHTLIRALTSLEEEVSSAQALVQQLTASLADLRQQVLALSIASPAPMALAASPAERAELRLYCFGLFEVYCEGTRIPQRCGKVSSILKYLASRPRQPTSRDVLLEVLWPGAAPDIANNRLKVAMHHLRRMFALAIPQRDDPVILCQDGHYFFNPQIQVWTDVEAFRGSWQAGLRLERSGSLAGAVPFYQQAVRLYRGDFLEEDLFEEWTLALREELRDTYLTVLDKLSRYWFQVGQLDRAVEGWKKIVATDAWREDAYRHLMVCYSRVGQIGLALHWYNLCVQALRDQLDLPVAAETVALYERIRAGERVDTLVE